MNLQEVNNITMTEGTVRTIHDSNGKLLWGKLTYSTTYDGDTEQDGTPTPDSPVAVDVVTGSQTVTISDGTNTGSFTVNLGTTELCKIDTYQDYIYKDTNGWYIHKEIDKYIFNGSESWTSGAYGTNSWVLANVIMTQYDTTKTQILSTKFRGVANSNRSTSGDNIIYTANNYEVWIRNTSLTSLSDVQTATSGTPAYYRTTDTNTQITDATLIGQLNSIHQFLTRYGYTGTVSGSLPLVINQTTLS